MVNHMLSLFSSGTKFNKRLASKKMVWTWNPTMVVKPVASYDPVVMTYDTAKNSTHVTINFHQYIGTKHNDLHLHILHVISYHGAW